MCGLNFGLVEGAHVYPARAEGSPDTVWNGIALCRNHHAAFDRHLLWVDPHDRRIIVHPEIRARGRDDLPTKHFLDSTGVRLRELHRRTQRPRTEMFERRYAFAEGSYAWIFD
jgi:predicted restriction endonuclease